MGVPIEPLRVCWMLLWALGQTPSHQTTQCGSPETSRRAYGAPRVWGAVWTRPVLMADEANSGRVVQGNEAAE